MSNLYLSKSNSAFQYLAYICIRSSIIKVNLFPINDKSFFSWKLYFLIKILLTERCIPVSVVKSYILKNYMHVKV